MTDTPIVSVVMPVRNAANTIDASLNSVLAQTFASFELIVVDDGSTDRTSELVRLAAGRDSRIRVHVNQRSGITSALNQGISVASGRYIARQDGDDLSMPDRLERQVRCLDARSDLCALGTGAVALDESGRRLGPLPTRLGAAAVRDGLRSARSTPVHGSMMMRRESLDAVGGYREAFVAAQDFDLWLRLSERWNIDNLEAPLYQWRLTPESVYGSRRQIQLLYCGIALAFAAERVRLSADSCALLEQCANDLEAFAAKYRLRGLLRALWGELLLRGINDSRLASEHFGLALRHGHVHPRTLLFWVWTSIGLPWIGGKPMRAPQLDTRAHSGAKP